MTRGKYWRVENENILVKLLAYFLINNGTSCFTSNTKNMRLCLYDNLIIQERYPLV